MRWIRKLLGRSGTAEAPATAAELRDERLSAYLDGELTAADAAALERELDADAELRAELDTLRVVRSALRSLGEVRAPRSFALAAPPAPAPRRLAGIELLTPLATAAAGLLLVFVLVAPGGGDATSRAGDEVASMAAPEAATMQQTPALVPAEAARGAALAAPDETPSPAEPGAADAPADDAGDGAGDAAGGGTAGEADGDAGTEDAAQPPTALADDAAPVPFQDAGADEALESDQDDNRMTLAAGLAVLTVVLAALSARQWRRRRSAGD